MPLGGVPAHALGPTQTAHAGDIDLYHVDAADVHELPQLAHVANLLAGGDAHGALSGQASVTLEIIRMQRLLEPGEVERLELFRAANGGRGVPAKTRVHHQL